MSDTITIERRQYVLLASTSPSWADPPDRVHLVKLDESQLALAHTWRDENGDRVGYIDRTLPPEMSISWCLRAFDEYATGEFDR